MNAHARRRNVNIELAYLEEVVTDVLQEAKGNSEGELTGVDMTRILTWERTWCNH